MIDAAPDLNSLRIPPSNHLQRLEGKQKEQYSIRINQQWRIYFKWKDGDAYDFKMSPKFWLNLQAHYDLGIQSYKLKDKLDLEVKIFYFFVIVTIFSRSVIQQLVEPSFHHCEQALVCVAISFSIAHIFAFLCSHFFLHSFPKTTKKGMVLGLI